MRGPLVLDGTCCMDTNEQVHSKAGVGKPGYCKICDSPFAFQVNKLLSKGQNYTQVTKALEPFDFTFNRQTLYKHRDHSSDPKTTFVKKAQREGAVTTVSNEQFLESIRDAAARNVELSPESVTVDQGIKAATSLMADRTTKDTLAIVLMKVMTGRREEVIEGDWREVKELPNNDGASD